MKSRITVPTSDLGSHLPGLVLEPLSQATIIAAVSFLQLGFGS